MKLNSAIHLIINLGKDKIKSNKPRYKNLMGKWFRVLIGGKLGLSTAI